MSEPIPPHAETTKANKNSELDHNQNRGPNQNLSDQLNTVAGGLGVSVKGERVRSEISEANKFMEEAPFVTKRRMSFSPCSSPSSCFRSGGAAFSTSFEVFPADLLD